jgi:hypothetical protein
MLRKVSLGALVVACSLVLISPASAIRGKPNFTPALWADGELWATKATAILPGPKGNNLHSFDKLFAIINSNNPSGQLPVAEASPRNFNYNGGRWYTHTVLWTESAFTNLGTVPVLTSYQDVMMYYNLGYLDITPGSPAPPPDGPPDFFECPLFPVKIMP